jgi:ubiquinone/menaquinone biosynthesis C-methylase UbiE
MPERTFDDFDDFAGDYRLVHSENIKLSGADSYYFAEMKVQLLKRFENNQVINVLDVGCGDGATELFMQNYFPQWSVTGIDISGKSIEVASGRNLSNAVFTEFNGNEIPFADNSVDIVFMAGVLHHVAFDMHKKILQEIHRVLKAGGRFYLYEHNPVNPLTRYLVNTCIFDKGARLLKSNYATGLLKANGFKIKEKSFIIFFPRKGILSKLIFLEKYISWLPLGGQYMIRGIKYSGAKRSA